MNPAENEQTRPQRRHRREFIRAHHPDVGGDPETFRRGLQLLGSQAPVRVVAVRSSHLPFATIVRLWQRRRQRQRSPRVH